MPESDSAKVFSTNLFTKEYLKPPCQLPITAGTCARIRRSACPGPLPGALPAIKHSGLFAQHRRCIANRERKVKALYLTSPGRLGPAAGVSVNGGMNGSTVYGFNRKNHWLKDELMGFAKSLHKLPS